MNDDSSPTDDPDWGDGDPVRMAVDAFDELFLVVDESGGIRDWNYPLVERTGYAEQRLDSMTLTDLVPETQTEAVEATLAQAAETGISTVDVTLLAAGGLQMPYELRAARLSSGFESGPAIGILAREVTDQQATLQPRRDVLGRMTDAFFAVDETWRLTYVNEQARPILAAAMDENLSVEEMIGRDFWEAIPEAVDTPFYDRYHEAMERQTAVTFEEYYEPLGTWLEVRAYPSETGLSVYFRNVTEEREQRELLREREQTLRKCYDVTADQDLSFDEQIGQLLAIGREVIDTKYGTLSRIEGGEGEVEGEGKDEYVFEVVDAADDAVRAGDVIRLSDTTCERVVGTRETLVLGEMSSEAPELAARAGNQKLGVDCYLGAPVFVDDEVYGTLCFYDDEPRADEFDDFHVTLVDIMAQWVSYELTHQHTREQLREQNEQLEEFASIVSHDLRNPLNVLDGAIEFAEETGDPEHFERCRRAIDQMETLIEDLLALSRAGQRLTDREPIDLAPLVEDCVPTVDGDGASGDGDAPGVSLTVDTDLTVLANETRLRQLVTNLLRNAIEHGGDSVRIRVGDIDEPVTDTAGETAAGDSENAADSETAGFYVADDGPGIPPEERETVFDAGYSTDQEGTGFGLNIVAQVVDAHGWTVSIAESDDGGARFEFREVETGD